MDAIVLVGGQGTRLRPLTSSRHKSLVPVCNTPAIEYLFAWLRRSGFERAVLALGQSNEDLAERYPEGDHDGLRIVPVLERERLESGGAIRHAVREAGIEGRFTVLNGDVFVDFDFADALNEHIEKRADLTLALTEIEDPSQFGVAVCDAQSLVTGFVEKPPMGEAPSKLVNAGVWIFEPGLVAEIPPGAVRVEETLFPSLVGRRRRVLGYRFEGIWADIGTHARYLALNRALLAQGACEAISAGTSIAPGADVRDTSLGEGCVVESGATISGSICWERVTIGSGAKVSGCILADGVSVGDGVVLRGVVAGSAASIPEGAVVPPGAIIDAGARYDGQR